MNKYSHVAILLTSISSLGWLTVAIAKEQVSLDNNHQNISNLKSVNYHLTSPKPKLIHYSPDFTQITHQNAHQELNAIANKSLLAAVLDGKLKTKVKTSSKSPSPVISDNTIALVKEFEGFRSYAYLDTDGTPVIGYGQSRIQGRKVRLGDQISYPSADAALKAELNTIQQKILSVVKVDLNSNQLGAVSSLAFNTGVYAIKRSTLVRKLNQKDYNGAANEFLRWDKANVGGKLVRMKGLTRRRHRERELFLTPVAPSVASIQDS